jgi:hypothetical protein
VDRAQNSDLSHFLGDSSQIEKLSKIKPPLIPIFFGLTYAVPVIQIFSFECFHFRWVGHNCWHHGSKQGK